MCSLWWMMSDEFEQCNSLGEPDCLPVNSLVMALFCRLAEQMRSSQGGRNSWWLARSSAMVLGEPGEDLCSPSPSWQPSSMESTSRKRDCWGGLTLSRGRRTHLGTEGRKKENYDHVFIIFDCKDFSFWYTNISATQYESVWKLNINRFGRANSQMDSKG